MFIFLTLATLLFVFLCSLVAFLLIQSRKRYRKEQSILDMFWVRRDRIPLLLEIVNPQEEYKNQVIELRSSLMRSRDSLEEIKMQERRLGQLLANIIEIGKKEDRIKRNALFLSLIKEFEVVFDKF